MKRTFVLLAAALALFVVSSIQAAEVQIEIYSQSNGQRLALAKNSHVALVDANGQKVAESDNNWKYKFNVEPGEYLLVGEEATTNFTGSVGIVVAEKNDPKLFMLTKNGMNQITDKHSCPENHLDSQDKVNVREADCEHDKNCICHEVVCNPNYEASNAVAQYPTSNTIPTSPLSTTTPPLPMTSGYGATGGSLGGLGSLALMGAIGGIIAIAVSDDEPQPISREIFYR